VCLVPLLLALLLVLVVLLLLLLLLLLVLVLLRAVEKKRDERSPTEWRPLWMGTPGVLCSTRCKGAKRQRKHGDKISRSTHTIYIVLQEVASSRAQYRHCTVSGSSNLEGPKFL